MFRPYDEDALEGIFHDQAVIRLSDSKESLIYQLSRIAKDPYMEDFLGMFLFSLDNDQPHAMKIAKEFNLDKKDIVILNEDIDKFIEIESNEDFLDNWGTSNG